MKFETNVKMKKKERLEMGEEDTREQLETQQDANVLCARLSMQLACSPL